MCKLKTCLIAKPSFTKPPVVNSRLLRRQRGNQSLGPRRWLSMCKLVQTWRQRISSTWSRCIQATSVYCLPGINKVQTSCSDGVERLHACSSMEAQALCLQALLSSIVAQQCANQSLGPSRRLALRRKLKLCFCELLCLPYYMLPVEYHDQLMLCHVSMIHYIIIYYRCGWRTP